MGYQSSKARSFLDTAAAWFSQGFDLLVMIRYSHAAGNKSYELFPTFDAFLSRLNELEPQTCVIVFRTPQLELRGVVDEPFIEAALSSVPDGKEYLMVGLDQVTHGKFSWFPDWAGINHEGLREDLHEARGQRVAIGRYPDWLVDNDDVISAVVPLPDGTVQVGIY